LIYSVKCAIIKVSHTTLGGETIMSEQRPIEMMELSINKMDFWNAREIAKATVKNGTHSDLTDAKFWLMYGVVVRKIHRDDKLLYEIRNSMRKCSNRALYYVEYGDLLRDDALFAAKRRQMNRAEKMLKAARDLHVGDVFRLTLANMAEAEICYLRRDYRGCLRLCEIANAEGPFYGKTEMWIKKNRLLTLKSMVTSKIPESNRKMKFGYLACYKNPIRFRAHLINSGRLGNNLDTLLFGLKI